jgi:hypothetical protein
MQPHQAGVHPHTGRRRGREAGTEGDEVVTIAWRRAPAEGAASERLRVGVAG